MDGQPWSKLPSQTTTKATERLAKKIEKTKIQFERVKLDKICGEIRKYPGWKALADFYIEIRCPKSEQAFMLRSLLEPIVKEEVENVGDNVMLL